MLRRSSPGLLNNSERKKEKTDDRSDFGNNKCRGVHADAHCERLASDHCRMHSVCAFVNYLDEDSPHNPGPGNFFCEKEHLPRVRKNPFLSPQVRQRREGVLFSRMQLYVLCSASS